MRVRRGDLIDATEAGLPSQRPGSSNPLPHQYPLQSSTPASQLPSHLPLTSSQQMSAPVTNGVAPNASNNLPLLPIPPANPPLPASDQPPPLHPNAYRPTVQPVTVASLAAQLAPAGGPTPRTKPLKPSADNGFDVDTWNGYPDGTIILDLTAEQAEYTKCLETYWACHTAGGNKGQPFAETWQEGHVSFQRCLGVIVCENADCAVLLRPATRKVIWERQLENPCSACGGELERKPCPAKATLYKFRHGLHYEHKGVHNHQPPTHVLHLLRNQQWEFRQIVEANPTVGALSFVMGAPNRPPVGNIAAPLENVDRVRKEQQKLRQEGLATDSSGQSFLGQLRHFQTEHPHLIRHLEIAAGKAMICLQNETMRKIALLDIDVADLRARDPDLDGPFALGLVSDAAHGFWNDRNAILIFTSAYSQRLGCWVPVLISYSDGQSADHYQCHFSNLFESLAEYADSEGIPVTKELFAMVRRCFRNDQIPLTYIFFLQSVDFSSAQRLGYIRAFCDFWKERDENPLSDDELEEIAARLLKGCRQHYSAQVTRTSNISLVVLPKEKSLFRRRALDLLKVISVEELEAEVNRIVQKWPATTNFFKWWTVREHAMMLFPSHQIDHRLFDQLQDTTNAEEAMHPKLYKGIKGHQDVNSRKFDVVAGLYALADFAMYWHRQYLAVQSAYLLVDLQRI